MSDKLETINLEHEKRLLADKIHRLLNKFHDKTGVTVAGLVTEHESNHEVIHYRTALTLYLDEGGEA